MIGVEDATALDAVKRELSSASIPSDAAVVLIEPRPELRLTLQERLRPVQGGFQIQNPNPQVGACTLGFNARVGTFLTTRVFVTASHCSDRTFELDQSRQHQPTVSGSSNEIGAEFRDAGCNDLFCRWSDASLYRYNLAVGDDYGKIGRTTSYGIGGRGSITIDSNDRFFSIVEEVNPAREQVGEYINKVGRRSGWTRGAVTQTCVWLAHPGGAMRCQNVAAVWSEGGDSGSPIFYAGETGQQFVGPSEARLLGVLWGGPAEDFTTTYYSTMQGIELDLGAMKVCPSPPCP